jgi:hypothetical protein
MEMDKDMFGHLIGKFGKKDVLDVVPWNLISETSFDDENIGGQIEIAHSGGSRWCRGIAISRAGHNSDDRRRGQIESVFHEAAHYIRDSVEHDKRFAAICWGLALRAGLFKNRDEWRDWTAGREWYDVQDDDKAGAGWARYKATQLANSSPMMFRVRLFATSWRRLAWTGVGAVWLAGVGQFFIFGRFVF